MITPMHSLHPPVPIKLSDGQPYQVCSPPPVCSLALCQYLFPDQENQEVPAQEEPQFEVLTDRQILWGCCQHTHTDTLRLTLMPVSFWEPSQAKPVARLAASGLSR